MHCWGDTGMIMVLRNIIWRGLNRICHKSKFWSCHLTPSILGVSSWRSIQRGNSTLGEYCNFSIFQNLEFFYSARYHGNFFCVENNKKLLQNTSCTLHNISNNDLLIHLDPNFSHIRPLPWCQSVDICWKCWTDSDLKA